MIAVLDNGAVSALAPSTERGRARLSRLRDRCTELVIPSAVLAEGVLRGKVAHDHHVRTVLRAARIADLDEERGFSAGRLRSAAMRSGTRPSGVDAAVAAEADALALTTDVLVLTSDDADLRSLLVHATNRSRISVQHV